MKQAIVVIHGIGEQRPLATIRGFVTALTDGLIRSKPDRLSESFELRRFSLKQNRSMPPTDVYELYWAHHMTRPRWSETLAWMARLVFRRSSSLPRGLRPLHRALWAVLLLAVGGTLFSAWQAFAAGNGLQAFLTSAITYAPAAALVVQLVLGRAVLGYVGDAARYLTPDPPNIQARAMIRAEGVKLLRRLHRSRRYARVMVVGHSLGSVIGYDVLRHLWDEMRFPSFKVAEPQPEAEGFEQASTEVIEPPDGVSRGQAVETFQQAQLRLWREQRRLGTPWLVTDFVTLGSPLAHAELLLEDPLISLRQRKDERELPTCPPTSGGEPAHYGETHDVETGEKRRKWHFRILNHGAVFASTRWTNLYFPHRRLILGDVVGGPLADVFGAGLRDVEVRPSIDGFRPRTLASHTMYWRRKPGAGRERKEARQRRKELDRLTGTKDAIVALRSALELEAKRAKEPWPDP